MNSEKEYIACQGPLEGTCEDFWHMILQYRASKIVMLTKVEERSPHNPSQLVVRRKHVDFFVPIKFVGFFLFVIRKNVIRIFQLNEINR